MPLNTDDFTRPRKPFASISDRRPPKPLEFPVRRVRSGVEPSPKKRKFSEFDTGTRSDIVVPAEQLILHDGLRKEFKKMSLGTFIDVVQSFSKFFFFVSRDRPELLHSINKGLEPTVRHNAQQELQRDPDPLPSRQSYSEEESIEDTLEDSDEDGTGEDPYNNGLAPNDYTNLPH